MKNKGRKKGTSNSSNGMSKNVTHTDSTIREKIKKNSLKFQLIGCVHPEVIKSIKHKKKHNLYKKNELLQKTIKEFVKVDALEDVKDSKKLKIFNNLATAD